MNAGFDLESVPERSPSFELLVLTDGTVEGDAGAESGDEVVSIPSSPDDSELCDGLGSEVDNPEHNQELEPLG